MDEHRYEIRRDGVTVCNSCIPRCGYSASQIREMIDAGYRYCVDGKVQKKGSE